MDMLWMDSTRCFMSGFSGPDQTHGALPGPCSGSRGQDISGSSVKTRRTSASTVFSVLIRRGSRTGNEYTAFHAPFSLVGLLFTYAILRLQHLLPLNPQAFGPVRPDLAFNTAVSFTTNTNWQNYGGESTLSYFSQMVGLAFHNFVSAATGASPLPRPSCGGLPGIPPEPIGNFWVDLVRVNLFLLLPLCVVYALFLVSQGMIQNFKPYETAQLVEPFTVQVPKKEQPARKSRTTKAILSWRMQKVETQTHRAGAGRLAGGDQDAGNQRRRVLQRQCLASL